MRQIFLILLLSSIIMLNLVQGQTTQTVQRTINLQQNELMNLNLEEFYDFTASSFSYPSNLPPEMISIPYQEFNDQKSTGNSITSLASVQDGIQTKYLIGYTIENNQSNMNVILIYYKLTINQTSGVLMRQEIAQSVLFQNLTMTQYAYLSMNGSFYSVTSGFVTASANDIKSFVQFVYTTEKGLIITPINNQNIGVHKAIQDPNSGNIFLICQLDFKTVNLFSFDSSKQILTLLESRQLVNILAKYYQLLMQAPQSLILFDSYYSYFANIAINFDTQKLKLQTIQVDNDGTTIMSGRVVQQGDNLSVIMDGVSKVFYYTFKQQQLVNNGELQLIRKLSNPLKSQLYQQSLIINEDYLVYENNNNNLVLYNLKTATNIFVTKFNNSNARISVPLYDFIGNQFLIQINTKNAQGSYDLLPVKIQVPSITLSGKDSSYQLTAVSSDSSQKASIQITVSTTQSMVTSFTQNSVLIPNYLTQFTDQVYSFSVESYIIGSNLNPKVDTTAAASLKNISFNKLVDLQTVQTYINNQFSKVYHTDGFISSIIVSSNANNNIFTLSAAAPNITSSNVNIYQQVSQLSSNIGAIDNYGTFLPVSMQSSNQKTIFVPFIDNGQLNYNQIPNISCSNSNFNFASDPSQNILFVQCGANIIQYQYSFSNDGNAQILQQTTLSQDFSAYNKLICIDGNLFTYNDTQIACYNYNIQSMLPNVVQVPKLSTKQQLILFRDTFFIVVLDNPISTISQYSYGDFQSVSSAFFRNLFVDNNSPINPNFNFIAKRNEIEYLFLSTTNTNEYLIYRVNADSSQNQLYTSVTIISDSQNIPVISSEAICILSGKVTCRQIFKEAQISFQMAVSQTQFNNILQLSNPLSLSFGNQQIEFDIDIIRYAGVQYGIVNQNVASLQNFRTQLQESNVTVNSTYSFNDHNVFSGCLVGWDSYQNGNDIDLINRMSLQSSVVNNITVNEILYKLQVSISENQLAFENLATIQVEGVNTNCTILEDQSSVVNTDANSFNVTLYSICPKNYYTFNATFYQQPNGDLTNMTVETTGQTLYLNSYDLRSVQQIRNVNGEILLTDQTNSKTYVITLDQSVGGYTVNLLKSDNSSIVSYNIINDLKLSLQFYSNGFINVTNTDNKQVTTTVSLQDLLTPFLLSISAQDTIQAVIQFNDNQFMIQANSFLYEVTFNLNDKKQIFIEKALLYYYTDGLENINFVLQGSKYTLIFGQYGSYPMVLLYTKANQSSYQLLIETSFSSNNIEQKGQWYTFGEFITDSQVKLYTTLGDYSIVNISDEITIKIKQVYDYIQRDISLFPKHRYYSNTQKVEFTIYPQKNNNPSITSSLRRIFSFKNLVVLIVIAFM